MSFKSFSSLFSSGSYRVNPSGPILAILVGSHLDTIPLKFESNCPKGLGGVHIYSKLFTIFRSDGQLVHRSGTVLSVLEEGHLSNIPVKFRYKRPRGIGGVDVFG